MFYFKKISYGIIILGDIPDSHKNLLTLQGLSKVF